MGYSIDRWSLAPQLGAVAGRRAFPSSNRWGIPDLLPQRFSRSLLHRPLCRYRAIDPEGICHFFLNDARFESVWNRPKASLDVVRRYAAVLTPDFSLYRDRPLAEQIWNTYRSRWMGRLWQDEGLRVIPSISWSRTESYHFCFAGIPQRQIVAIAAFGLGDRLTRRFFTRGLDRLVGELDPSGLIVFGIPAGGLRLRDLIPRTCRCAVHPNRWQEMEMEPVLHHGEHEGQAQRRVLAKRRSSDE